MSDSNHIAALPLNKRQRALCGELARQILIRVCGAMNDPNVFGPEDVLMNFEFDRHRQETAQRGAYFTHDNTSAFEKADDTLIKLGVFEGDEIHRVLEFSADEVAVNLAERSDLTLLHLAEALSGFFELPEQIGKHIITRTLLEALYECGFIDVVSDDSAITKQILIASWVYENPQYDGPAYPSQKLAEFVKLSDPGVC